MARQSIGGVVRLGFPVTEYVSFGTRYSLVQDEITLDEDTFFTDLGRRRAADRPNATRCKAGRYLCDELGKNLTSVVGYSVAFDNTNGIRATRGQRMILSQDFAGLGGDVKYLRTAARCDQILGLPPASSSRSTARAATSIRSRDRRATGQDAIRLTDRFFGPTDARLRHSRHRPARRSHAL